MFAFGVSLGSMAEVASLTSELDVLRGKKSPGTVVNLFLPYFVLLVFIYSQDRKPLIVTVAFDGKNYKFKNTLEDMENGTNSPYPKKKTSVHERKRRQSLASRLKPLFAKRGVKHKGGLMQIVKRKFKSEKGVHYLDQYSRILFPLGYGAFLTAYFVIYMVHQSKRLTKMLRKRRRSEMSLCYCRCNAI